MKPRLDYDKASPAIMKSVLALENAIQRSGLDPILIELVKLRASQINGCAYCIHMHSNDLRKRGESEDRMHLLAAWRESPLYTAPERAALAWTEALTLVSRTHAPDDVYEEARRHFSEDDLVKLTVLIGMINLWNRIAIGFRSVHPVETGGAAAAQ
jgi:AhpD family alkylhydroperoxidase